MQYFWMQLENNIFQHDNDPKHTSRKAQKWLEYHHTVYTISKRRLFFSLIIGYIYIRKVDYIIQDTRNC